MRSAPHIIEGELVARETEVAGDFGRATASFIRNSAMAASPMSMATSSPSTSKRPARSACSTASSSAPLRGNRAGPGREEFSAGRVRCAA